MTSPGDGDRGEQPVGGLAEEAAKLFEALKGLSADSVAGTDRLADGAGLLWEDLNRHLANDGDCRYCPVCQLIGLVRQPEVRGHLTAAGRSLVAALASALATRVPDEPRTAPPEPPRSADDGAA